jgi:hypothetical protein
VYVIYLKIWLVVVMSERVEFNDLVVGLLIRADNDNSEEPYYIIRSIETADGWKSGDATASVMLAEVGGAPEQKWLITGGTESGKVYTETGRQVAAYPKFYMDGDRSENAVPFLKVNNDESGSGSDGDDYLRPGTAPLLF